MCSPTGSRPTGRPARDYADALADFLAAVRSTVPTSSAIRSVREWAQCFAIHHPGRIIKLRHDRHRHRPEGHAERRRRPRSSKAARRRSPTASTATALGFRAARLEGAARRPSPLVQRGAARHQSARLHARRQARPRRTATAPRKPPASFTMPVLLISGREDRVNPIDKNALILVKALQQTVSLKFSRASATCPRSRRPTPSTRCCAISSRN